MDVGPHRIRYFFRDHLADPLHRHLPGHGSQEQGRPSRSLLLHRRRILLASLEERVEELLKPVIEEIGYSLYDLQYVKEGKDFYLRIYIDKEEGISLEDCEKVNNQVSDLLDEKSGIKDPYFLEVSSPGIERMIRKERHLQENIGNKIEVRLFKPLEGKKVYEGILNSFNEEMIELEEIKIPRKDIATMKTVYDWE